MFTAASRTAIDDFILKDDKYRTVAARLKAAPALQAGADTGEIQKYYTLNQTGNIMVSSTVSNEKDLSDDVKALFQKTIVFFGAWAAALEQKKKSLYDYEAIATMINKSGFFVRVHEEDRTFESGSTSLTLDTAILGSVLSGVASMGGTTALSIAQTVIGSMGSQLKLAASSKQETKKIAHLLFVCENLMGMPILNVLLFNTSAKQSETVTSSNCHKTVSTKVSMAYHQDTFMFVDPTYIDKFSTAFQSNPDYDALIKRLADYLS